FAIFRLRTLCVCLFCKPCGLIFRSIAAIPACARIVIAAARLHPALALRGLLLLPEWRLGLEVIHDEFAGGEGVASMRAADGHEHDLVAGAQGADTVDDARVVDIPACPGLIDDGGKRLLGHARVMFQ